MSRASRKIEITILAAAILAGIFTCLVWAVRISAPPRLSISLLGYTNDASGVRFAQVSVTSLNAATVGIYSPFVITNETPSGYQGYGVPPANIALVLNGGSSQIFNFRAPPNPSRWRFQIFCDPNVAARQGFRRIAFALADVIRARGGAQKSTYNFESDWISGGNGTNVITKTVSAP
jgi:hypothetical protein